MIQFEISTVTPEEELRDRAQCIVYGYQHPHLGHLQRTMLRNMHIYRHSNPQYWGATYERKRVLGSLSRRGLVEKVPYQYAEWKLTPLGEQVASLLLRA